MKAICLLSGGLDSATTLRIALRDGFKPLALTIDYGQLHSREIISAKALAKHYKISQTTVKIELPWRGSALLDSSIPMPKNRSESDLANGIPASYVPARNTIFLSLAASFAEAEGASHIFIGANAIDYSGYPDCRPEYLSLMEKLLAQGTKCGQEGKAIQIEAPLLRLKKSEIIALGTSLQVPYELTWSCYEGQETPCGECDSCILRTKGFEEAGLQDPLFAHER